MIAVDSLKSLNMALHVVSNALRATEKNSIGYHLIDECSLDGVVTILDLVGGEIQGMDERDLDLSVIALHPAKANHVEGLRMAYLNARRDAHKLLG